MNNQIAILINPSAPSHIMQAVMKRDICVKDGQGNVYATCWYSRPPEFQDNEDQWNLQKPIPIELLQDFHAQKKAVILHGFESMGEVLDAFNLTRCNPDGSDIEETEH